MLPALRQDLSLHPGPAARDGSPTWTIRDPVRNRYFRISWPVLEILNRWDLGDEAAVAEAVSRETTLHPDPADIQAVVRFLDANQLVVPAGPAQRHRLGQLAQAGHAGWLRWLLHHYLFFRIPLVRPDRLLTATLGWVRWLGRPWFRRATLAALAAGLLLVGRQWQVFAASLVDTLTLSGLLSYGVALGGVKIVHELAHAYTARAHGCRVPTMGVAFLVLWPVLYTDVNEAWTLPDRRQRLRIGAAGILAELTVAAWSSLLWAFLPEGGLRQAAFVLAATTWVSSLVVNLSPFMRFDGYFLLMDWLEMPNLHHRAFAIGRWALRRMMFGLDHPPPEPLSPAGRVALPLFAYAVWIYRLIVFLGIAVLVYHFFIKAVGIMLFMVEIGWFVLRPAAAELKAWYGMRQEILATPRRGWRLVLALVPLAVLLFPWQSQIAAPAVLKAADLAELYVPVPARLVGCDVVEGQAVEAGQVLLRFTSPDHDSRRAQLQAQRSGRAAEVEATRLDPAFRGRAPVAAQELARIDSALAALDADIARLTVRAPLAGRVRDLAQLQPGEWVSPRHGLGMVVGEGGAVAVLYVDQSDMARLGTGATARFVPTGLDFAARDGRVSGIEPTTVSNLPDAMLASVHGGAIAARAHDQKLIPDAALYRGRAILDGPAPGHELTGTVLLQGERRSLAARVWRAALVVLVREWGT